MHILNQYSNQFRANNPEPHTHQHSPSGWCVYSKFAYREAKDPLKLYRGKDCLQKSCDYIRQEAHRL